MPITDYLPQPVIDLADWCVIDVVDEKGGLRRVASAHNNPAKEKLMVELQEKFPPDWDSPQPSARVLRTGKSELLQEVTDELMAERVRNPQHMKLIKDIGINSHIAVVLSARGNKLGAISLGLSEGDGKYGPDDLSLAEELGRRAAFARSGSIEFCVALLIISKPRVNKARTIKMSQKSKCRQLRRLYSARL